MDPKSAGVVLLVEDSSVFREILRIYLEGMVDEIVEAEDGVAALALIEKREVSLVVTDLSMPRMDGIEFIHQLRSSQTARIRTVPVILLTAERQSEEFARAGADGIVFKPVKPLAFRAAVQRLLAETGPR